jgi:hypothetical protein
MVAVALCATQERPALQAQVARTAMKNDRNASGRRHDFLSMNVFPETRSMGDAGFTYLDELKLLDVREPGARRIDEAEASLSTDIRFIIGAGRCRALQPGSRRRRSLRRTGVSDYQIIGMAGGIPATNRSPISGAVFPRRASAWAEVATLADPAFAQRRRDAATS